MLEMKTQLKKEQEEKRRENLKKAAEIQKSKQDLLEKLIEEQKKIIMKLEEKKATIKADEKATMMSLLKSLGSSIEKAKEDVKQAMQLTQGKRDVSLLVQAFSFDNHRLFICLVIVLSFFFSFLEVQN